MSKVTVRSSTIGPCSLTFFAVNFDLITGVFSFTELKAFQRIPEPVVSATMMCRGDQHLAGEVSKLFADCQGNRARVRLGFLKVLTDFATPHLGGGGVAATNDDSDSRVRRILEEHPESQLLEYSVEELSRLARCSTRHFSRLFKKFCGVSLRAKQSELRLLKARQVLWENSDKIIDVAHACGFRSLALFNLMFRRRFGMTPSEMRVRNPKKKTVRRLGRRSGEPTNSKGKA